MNKSIRIYIMLLVVIFAPITVIGQLKSINTFPVNSAVSFASVDRAGELYIVLADGTLQRINADGKPEASEKGMMPTILEPRDGARIFAYYRTNQTYGFLNPSLLKSHVWYDHDSTYAINPHLICTSGDYNLLIIDAEDSSLKKINMQKENVVWEVSLSEHITNHSVSYIREYQNFIFLLTSNSTVLIFNSMGKHLRSIEGENIKYFNFIGEELYYKKKNKLIFFNLFTTERREMHLPGSAEIGLVTDERLYLIQKNRVEIFAFNPH